MGKIKRQKAIISLNNFNSIFQVHYDLPYSPLSYAIRGGEIGKYLDVLNKYLRHGSLFLKGTLHSPNNNFSHPIRRLTEIAYEEYNVCIRQVGGECLKMNPKEIIVVSGVSRDLNCIVLSSDVNGNAEFDAKDLRRGFNVSEGYGKRTVSVLREGLAVVLFPEGSDYRKPSKRRKLIERLPPYSGQRAKMRRMLN